MNKFLKQAYGFVKKNIFSCGCLLLAMLVLVTGSISYSKYLSGGSGGGFSGIGSFSVSANIDGVSALSFTNTAFWGGSASGDRIAMNALRSLKFSVNNYETDSEGNKKVADVRSKYTLSFSAPVVFAEKLAVQVFSETDQPIMPQIVLSDLKGAADSGKKRYDTSTSDDFNGADYTDLQFALSSGTDYYVATADGLTVTLEKYTKNVEQSLLFRMWDTSSVTSESNPTVSDETGKLQPPLTVTFTQDVEFYRIGIRSDDFVLPAGIETTVSYTVRLAPTDSIVDEHLGGIFVDKTTDSSGNVSSSPVTSVCASNQASTVQTTRESYTDSHYGDSTFSGTVIETETDSYNVMGSPKKYTQGETFQTIETSSEDLDLTTGEEGVVTTTKTKSKIEWTSFTVQSTAPTITLSNYKSNYEYACVRKNNDYGTIFFVHKLDAKASGTETITETTTESRVYSRHTTSRSKKITESTYVESIDSNQANIHLNITRKTEIVSIGEYDVETTVTTKTYTRELTDIEGYIYRGYYKKWVESTKSYVLSYWTSSEELVFNIIEGDNIDSDNDKNPTLTGKTCTLESFNSNETDFSRYEKTLQDETTTAELRETKSFKDTSSEVEYIERAIQREYHYSDITLTEVSMPETDADGNAVLENGVQKKIYYTAASPLELFQSQNGVSVQKYYLSQCYSKTYPFFVNTIFEQIL